MQNAPLVAFCNTFDLHYGIFGLGNQFLVFLTVAVLHRFYCINICLFHISILFYNYCNYCIFIDIPRFYIKYIRMHRCTCADPGGGGGGAEVRIPPGKLQKYRVP